METQKWLKSILSLAVIALLLFTVSCEAENRTKCQIEFQKEVAEISEKANFQIRQAKDIIDNNNLLWALVDSIWKSQDKSKDFVKKLADSQKLPRCSGRPCTRNDARLKTSSMSNALERSLTIGWGQGRGGYQYWFKILYDPKDRFVTIDVNDLLGRNIQNVEVEEEENQHE